MRTLEGALEGDVPALPPELRGARPYPLPRWARRGPAGGVGVLSLAVVLSAALLWFIPMVGAQALPLFLAALGAGMIWWRRRVRDILQTGTPLVARVERVTSGENGWQVQYSLEGPRGRETRWVRWGVEVLPDVALWPQPGDAVFLLADRKQPRWRVVWGFAWAPGQPRRPVPWLQRRLPAAGVAIAIAVALLLVGALVWWGLRP